MTPAFSHLDVERDGAVLIVRLANESARNALSREMSDSLVRVCRAIHDDRSVRAVYLTARGSSFCSGGDLAMLARDHSPWAIHRHFRHCSTLLPPLMMLDRPVVCGVRGHAVAGGLGLALTADLIVASETARFTSGFNALGTVPDCLTLFTLPRMVGLSRTRNFLLTNGTWTANDALGLGVVAQVVPDEELDREGLALAHNLTRGPAEVMGMSKLLLLKAFESSLDDLMLYEDLGQALAMSSAEFKEGLAALREKRKPDQLAAALNDPTPEGLPPS